LLGNWTEKITPVPEVEKADATRLFLVALHEVGLYVGMIFYFEFPKDPK
jgi:hypothetical protein